MKKAEVERLGIQREKEEVAQMRSKLMEKKMEEIIKEVVAPERRRALIATDEVTKKTLSADTLPLEDSQLDIELTDKDRSEISLIVNRLEETETARVTGILSE